MTVRLTPTESDSTPASQVPAPPQPSDQTVTLPVATGSSRPMAAPVDPSDAVVADQAASAGADSRIALRESRRQRRRTAWLCAAIVAVCLGLTIVVVSLARSRPAPSPGAVATSAPVLLVPATPTSGSTSLPSVPHLGAAAPEGGNR